MTEKRTEMKKALVLGAGGFIGTHLVSRLKTEGYWVRGVDLKQPRFSETNADDFVIGDLRDATICRSVLDRKFDEVFQLAADMGGAGYVFTGENDADIMHNSASVNLNVLRASRRCEVGKLLFSSSACVYPFHNQTDIHNLKTSENSVYPAHPDSEYGWEKLFSERLYLSFHRNYGMEVRIARYHAIFGPEGSWNDGREKAPMAISRKVAETPDGGEIEIWGDGEQMRSFLYIDECIEGTLRLMHSSWVGPVNIGSEEIITINALTKMIMAIAGKRQTIRYVPGPQGVRARKSDNYLIAQRLGWKPHQPLRRGLRTTYTWVERQVSRTKETSTDINRATGNLHFDVS